MRKTIENGITVLSADEGMKLTNGQTFGTTVRLGVHDSEDKWQEITEEEAQQMLDAMAEDEEATEADYLAELNRLGVEV